mmetsp:Transcript_9112/g.19115  ORF Transcript_9112/g.19115 Transcript_9112/m.19115 type:complete len:224 (+) Transcript_9112:119-790(+)|eukprot:CAMPEP_0201127850 /NCGR_PEP_ID=MMETSP0850-20130426/31768_1 /ASSEMBLY_ACC=CAM_ASM_000622 /TAXON_ID=183588 /ORGANISM="Pseudo-nitzschia fraudulenta, Strain WWA7" /LENGTH=223 /DNA_ID=CAMNT_0047396839 /DNA_START=138 /DNA_END=809 /DNA_ORIENTATION=+
MPEETAATVTVIAPANLNAGQTFEAEVDGKTFTVTVPDGGVEKGGKFEVDYPSKSAVSDAPTGSWRKGLCECFSACCCPFWMAWCLPGIVMAQVMERMNYNWFGSPSDTGKSPPLCLTYTIIIIACYIIAGATATSIDGLGAICFGVFQLYVLVAFTCARINFRKKYDIEPDCCGESCLGDCCCVYWCSCCVAIQMEQHTHDPNEHGYKCFSKTGKDSSVHIV